MTSAASALVVREIATEDEGAVIGLLTAALGAGPTGVRSPEFFTWKHRRNPFGSSPGLVAEHAGEVVGVRLFLRWQLESGNRRVRAVRAVDTATAPSFQGRGIFRRLTQDLLHRLDEAGDVDLVFNTPNSSSHPGYLKMGWQPVGSVPVRLSPVRPVRFLRGARQAGASTAGASTAGASQAPTTRTTLRPLPICPFPPAREVLKDLGGLSTLLAQTAPTDRLHTPLSTAYLQWRYADAPGLDYRCLIDETGGELAGVAFARMRRRGPLAELTLADLVVRDGDASAARRLLRLARRSGADHVAVHTAPGTEAAQVASRSGYLTVPRAGMAMVVNPRTATLPDPLLSASWRLSLGDLEVF